MEAIVKCEHSNVFHDNLYDRNIIIAPTPQKHVQLAAQPRPQLTIFDFNLITLWGTPSRDRKAPKSLPLSPVMRFWDSGDSCEFDYWVPQWWWDNEQKRREWLLKEFGSGRASEFQSLPEPLDLEKKSWDQPGYWQP